MIPNPIDHTRHGIPNMNCGKHTNSNKIRSSSAVNIRYTVMEQLSMWLGSTVMLFRHDVVTVICKCDRASNVPGPTKIIMRPKFPYNAPSINCTNEKSIIMAPAAYIVESKRHATNI